MKILPRIILILTTLLSIATGTFKILQQQADIELFQKIGVGVIGTTILGVVQLMGGILLIFPKYRKPGAVIMMVTFALASVAVFANQMYTFGVVSLLFIGMAYFVFKTTSN